MPSALEIAGSAHRATSPAFKLHAALACVQIALVTWICRAADIWRSKRTSEQFPGHLGPSVFIAAIGITALTAEWPWRTRAAIEGKLSMWGGGSYVAGEAVNRLLEGVHHQSALKHYLRHGLHAWMSLFVFCLGLAFLQASKLEGAAGARLARAPHAWFASACAFGVPWLFIVVLVESAISTPSPRLESHRWGWFIWAHKQPNNFGVAMHCCTSIWIAMGALLRVFGERNRPPREAGACYVFAAYAFFGGQMGLTLTAEASHVDVGAYVVIWHILPCCWLLAYVRLFLARAPADGYGAVATLDDEAPGIDPDDRPASRGSIML